MTQFKRVSFKGIYYKNSKLHELKIIGIQFAYSTIGHASKF